MQKKNPFFPRLCIFQCMRSEGFLPQRVFGLVYDKISVQNLQFSFLNESLAAPETKILPFEISQGIKVSNP